MYESPVHLCRQQTIHLPPQTFIFVSSALLSNFRCVKVYFCWRLVLLFLCCCTPKSRWHKTAAFKSFLSDSTTAASRLNSTEVHFLVAWLHEWSTTPLDRWHNAPHKPRICESDDSPWTNFISVLCFLLFHFTTISIFLSVSLLPCMNVSLLYWNL